VEVSVGKGVSVGVEVRVEIANVGNGEGSITGAAGGATSDQLQARAARINSKRERNHLFFMLFSEDEFDRVSHAEYSTFLLRVIFIFKSIRKMLFLAVCWL